MLSLLSEFFVKLTVEVKFMKVIMIVSIIIVFAVLILAVLTTSKAYKFKHTIDEAPQPQPQQADEKQEQ
jgi:uncharacterized membrane protein affecting hemolysin expression